MSKTRVIKAEGVQESEIRRVEAPEPRLFFLPDPPAEAEAGPEPEVKGEMILEHARREAEEIVENARREALQIHETARKEGYQQGYAEGKASALKELAQERADLEALREAAEADYRKRVWESEAEILKLAVEIAEVITRTTFSTQPEVWLHMVREAVTRVAGANELLLRVSPQDEPFLAANLPAIREVLTESAPIRWEADPTLKPGDLWVETNIGQVDARVSQQIQAVWTALKAGMNAE